MQFALKSPAIVKALCRNPYRMLFEITNSWLVSGGVAKNTATAAK